jgi:hypothetical protein
LAAASSPLAAPAADKSTAAQTGSAASPSPARPTITVASGLCTSLPTPRANAAGNKPSAATVAVISTGRNLCVAPPSPRDAIPRRQSLMIQARHHDTPFCTATPNMAMNPTALDTFSVMPRLHNASNRPASPPAQSSKSARMSNRSKRRVQQNENQRDHRGHDVRQPLLRPLLVLKLSAHSSWYLLPSNFT